MFWNVLSIENIKNTRRSILWIELAIMAVLVFLLELVLYVSLQTPSPAEAGVTPEMKEAFLQSLTWPAALIDALGFSASNALGGLLVIIFVAAITAQEYTWRTMHLWLSRGIRRPMLLAAKFSSLLLPIVLLVLTPLLAGGLITAWFSFAVNGTLHLEQLNSAQLVLSIFRTAYSLLPYAALAFLLGIATRSTVATIGIGLAYSMLVEGILLQILSMFSSLGKLARYLPGGLAEGLLQANQASLKLGMNLGTASGEAAFLSPAAAALGITIWTLLFLAAAVWVFERQDLSQ